MNVIAFYSESLDSYQIEDFAIFQDYFWLDWFLADPTIKRYIIAYWVTRLLFSVCHLLNRKRCENIPERGWADCDTINTGSNGDPRARWVNHYVIKVKVTLH